MNNEAANYVLFDMSLSAQVVLNSYIGGIGTFFGPAAGAAVMTFFGYAVSDLTRTWLLYQGVIFVLVMMFMPSGLLSVTSWWHNNSRRHARGRLLAVLGAWVLGCAIAAAGFVMTVELLADILAQDYQSLLVQGQPWPAVPFMGGLWLPGDLFTWLLPVVLMLAGVTGVILVSRAWRSMQEELGL
jgi:branched-chain amino acid transport system permease protein